MKKYLVFLLLILFLAGCSAEIKNAKEILEKDGFAVVDSSVEVHHLPEEEIPNYRRSMGMPDLDRIKEELLATNRDTSSKETVLQFYQFKEEKDAKEFFQQRLDQYKKSFAKDLKEVSDKASYQRYEVRQPVSETTEMTLIIIRKKDTVFYASTLEKEGFVNKYIKKFGLHR